MRILLFLATNLAIIVLASITFRLLGFESILAANGVDLDLGALLVFCALFGFGGAFVSLALSKRLAKWSTKAQIIERPSNADERWLLETVGALASKAGIGMPEVAIFPAQEPNAFATGANRNKALVAVSAGLLNGMNRGEVEAVLGHEIGHVANGDMVTLTLIQGVVNTFVMFLARVIGFFVDRVVLRNERGLGIGYWITTIVAEIVLAILAKRHRHVVFPSPRVPGRRSRRPARRTRQDDRRLGTAQARPGNAQHHAGHHGGVRHLQRRPAGLAGHVRLPSALGRPHQRVEGRTHSLMHSFPAEAGHRRAHGAGWRCLRSPNHHRSPDPRIRRYWCCAAARWSRWIQPWERFNPSRSLATAIAAAGDDDAISARIGPYTEVIELGGRLALPGFIEGHGHFLSLGRAQQILDLTAATRWDDIVAQVAVAVDGAEAGDWIFGRGWHQEKWREPPQPNVEGAPLNDGLNAVAPGNPVYLGHASGHAAFANDAALAAAGIDDRTPDPEGGTIVRAANGKATGLLRENAQELVEAAIARHEAGLDPEASEAMQMQRVQLAGEQALRFGVTLLSRCRRLLRRHRPAAPP